MPALKKMEVGVMFWAGPDAAATIRRVKSAGVRCGQLGIPVERLPFGRSQFG